MVTIWYISDTHFGHANMLTFKREDGTPLRDFASVEEMDELMIQRWNEVVRPQDHIWHLGDLTMLREKQIRRISRSIMARLNGHKRLILGNHDHGDPAWYAEWFEKVRGSNRVDRTLLFSHYPVHPDSLPTGVFNIHGHMHDKPSTLPYLNISVERTGYRPISLEEIKDRTIRA